jgi:hypothetical protein
MNNVIIKFFNGFWRVGVERKGYFQCLFSFNTEAEAEAWKTTHFGGK